MVPFFKRVSLLLWLISAASPASGRKSAPPLSRNSSPASSPKSGGGGGGRRQARLRLPQLGSRLRLSNSKENLEGSTKDGGANPDAEPKEGPLQANTEATGAEASGTGISAGHVAPNPLESSMASEASSSHCDVILMNGESVQSNGTEGSTDPGSDLDTSQLHQRENICLEPMYNLYAISVSELLIVQLPESFCRCVFV